MIVGIRYSPSSSLVGQPRMVSRGIHRRVPAHVGHEQEQHVDRLRIAGPGIADHRVQHAVHGQRIRPRVGVVDAARLAVVIHQQVFGPVDETERRRIELAVGVARLARPVGRRNRPRERRLVTKTARRIDRAQQQLQQVQRAAGVEAVAVRGDAAHRVHRHRPAGHLRVLAAVRVGPGDRQLQRIVERGRGQFAGDAADACRPECRSVRRPRPANIADRDSARRRGGRRGVALRPSASVNSPTTTGETPVALASAAAFGVAVPAQRRAVGVAREQAVIGRARVVDHQPVRVGVAHQVVQVDAVGLQQFMDQREREQAVGAGPDADPFIGDRAVAGAHRIDRDDLGAARLQLAEAELDRIGIVVFGHAPEHQVAACVPSPARRIPRSCRPGCTGRRRPCSPSRNRHARRS